MANMAQAIRMALNFGESYLDVKDIFGQDVGPPMGGVFTATQGLKTSWNTPLDERGIIGCAMGIALAGDRCVAEIQFCDYIFNSIDLLKMAGNIHWVSHGNYSMPLVLMTPTGAGIHGAIYHSHSFDAWATRMPGWKVVMPSNPYDAYGLLLSAIKDPNPVLYLPPKALLRVAGGQLIPGEPSDPKTLKAMIDAPLGDRKNWQPQWPGLTAVDIPIGKATRTRVGTDISVVSYGRTLVLCNHVADELIEAGISIEVIDLRSLYPYDWALIKQSIQKTGRALFVNEDTEVTNFAEHLCYRTTSELFYELQARPRILAGKNIPGVGLHPNLERATVPQAKWIADEVKQIVEEQP